MIEQPAERRRCGSCQRWSGPREIGGRPEHVAVTEETVTGLCQGGPWDGSERRARSACGHWLLWSALAATMVPSGGDCAA